MGELRLGGISGCEIDGFSPMAGKSFIELLSEDGVGTAVRNLNVTGVVDSGMLLVRRV